MRLEVTGDGYLSNSIFVIGHCVVYSVINFVVTNVLSALGVFSIHKHLTGPIISSGNTSIEEVGRAVAFMFC